MGPAGKAPSIAGAAASSAAPVGRLSVARNALYLAIAQVITTALAIAATAVLGRRLGAAEFGKLYLATATVTFAFNFVEWGQPPYVTRAIAQAPERTRELLGSSIVFRLVGAMIAFGVLAAVGVLLGYDARARSLVAMLVVATLPLSCGLVFSVGFRGNERMDLDAIASVCTGAFTAICSMLAVLLVPRAEAVVAATGVSGLLALGVYSLLMRRLQPLGLRVSLATLRELLFNALPFLALTGAIAARPYVDALILSRLAPEAAVGWYAAANRLIGTLIFPGVLLGAALYPILSRLAVEDRSRFQRATRSALRPILVFAALAGLGSYLFADIAIALLYSTRFSPAAQVLQAFSFFLFLIYVNMTLGYVVAASGRQRAVGAANVSMLVIGAALDLLLVPVFQSRYANGGIGVAISLGASELTMFVTMILLVPSGTLDRSLAMDFGRAIAAAVGTMAVGKMLDPAPPFVRVALILMVFAALALSMGLVRRDDIRLVRDAIRSRRG
jgi:O-antigen/teichoic acid export membrane protein